MSETSAFPFLVPLLAVALAAVHLFAGNLHLRALPRSYWLSAAGGVSVAYVFVHVLPELHAHQTTFEDVSTLAGFLEHHVYLLALVGFTIFYGLEQLVQHSRDSETARNSVADRGSATGRDSPSGCESGTAGDAGSVDGDADGDTDTDDDAETDGVVETAGDVEDEIEEETETRAGVFWVHVGTFAAYNGLIGYLLVHREGSGLTDLIVFFVAMALHFVVTDHGLREDHHEAYDEIGRWILSGGVVAGLGIGLATTVTEPVVSGLFALLAGGIVLNVIKEELPERCQSNFWAFGGGAMAYSLVLLFV